jgi:hypothetical protein
VDLLEGQDQHAKRQLRLPFFPDEPVGGIGIALDEGHAREFFRGGGGDNRIVNQCAGDSSMTFGENRDREDDQHSEPQDGGTLR